MAKYSKDVAHAIDQLVRKRFMLCEDTDAYYAALVQQGLDAGIPDDAKPNGPKSPESHIHACADPQVLHGDDEDND